MIKTKCLTLFFCFIFLCEFHPCFSKEWKRAYLSSYPQSGNHWVRYLIEEASHIATSSVYRDKAPPININPPEHMNKIFPWGGYCCDHGYEGKCRYPTINDIVLIKTHYPYPRKTSQHDRKQYEVAIHIVRHPIDSFYSRYEKLPHGLLQQTVPTKRLKALMNSWRKVQTYWINKKNLIIIRYEDMLLNPAAELKKMLVALNYKVTDEDIQRAVTKYPPQGYALKHISKYTAEDLKLISKELGDLLIYFGYTIP
jgi:hypothetical protein